MSPEDISIEISKALKSERHKTYKDSGQRDSQEQNQNQFSHRLLNILTKVRLIYERMGIKSSARHENQKRDHCNQ